jgi:TraM recognition site of TraD and TraG
MLQWFFGSFAGWLLRKQLLLLLDLCVLLTRIITRLFRLRPRGTLIWSSGANPEKASQDETTREAGCRQVVLDYAGALGYIARLAMSKDELEHKIYTEKVTPEELAGELHKRIAEIPGITLGFRPNGEGKLEVKLPFSMCDRHVYIIGRSGSGKTNLIRSMILQTAYYGHGVGVLAPEAELLTDEILPYIPENRIDDVVYIDPSDTSAPIAFNPLYLEEGEDREGIDLKVDDVLTTFKRLLGETSVRMDEILRQSLYALMQRRGSTLLDLEPLLDRNNSTLRDEIIRTSDEVTARFFRDTYPGYPKDAHIPITTRVSRLIRPKAVRALLCQPDRSFNFRKAMDEGKIVLFNLSDGVLGEQTSQLLGELIVSKMQLAAMSRADTPQAARRPFHLYLDEFQTFMGAAGSYAKILSRARKYKLCLCIAHQQTGQIPQELLKEIFGNVSTLLAFNVSHDDAVKLAREYAYEAGGVMEYVEPGEFLRLRTGEAIAKIGRTVLPLETVLLPQNPDHLRAEHIINRSRKNYSGRQNYWNVDIQRPDQKRLPPKANTQKPDDDDDLDPTQVF